MMPNNTDANLRGIQAGKTGDADTFFSGRTASLSWLKRVSGSKRARMNDLSRPIRFTLVLWLASVASAAAQPRW